MKYHEIIKHYENCLEQYGDTHKGVDWPNPVDTLKRYKVMTEIVQKDEQKSLLDFGCGLGHLLEYIRKENIKNIKYSGLDISKKFIDFSSKKFPGIDFYCLDVLENNDFPSFDYIAMNGVFTEKRELSFDEMFEYFKKVLPIVFEKSNIGIAFNMTSKAVQWERDDLFHMPIDLLVDFMTKNLSRNFVIRNDYGLYEYTVYLYK